MRPHSLALLSHSAMRSAPPAPSHAPAMLSLSLPSAQALVVHPWWGGGRSLLWARFYGWARGDWWVLGAGVALCGRDHHSRGDGVLTLILLLSCKQPLAAPHTWVCVTRRKSGRAAELMELLSSIVQQLTTPFPALLLLRCCCWPPAGSWRTCTLRISPTEPAPLVGRACVLARTQAQRCNSAHHVLCCSLNVSSLQAFDMQAYACIQPGMRAWHGG